MDLQLFFTLEGEPSRDGLVVNGLQHVLPGSDPGRPDWACVSASAYTLGSASVSLTACGRGTGVMLAPAQGLGWRRGCAYRSHHAAQTQGLAAVQRFEGPGGVRGLAEPLVQGQLRRRGGAARIKIGQSIAFEVALALQAWRTPARTGADRLLDDFNLLS